jgi:hypothetical protein
MALFTVILEFGGGTYISQIRSASVRGTVCKYASQLVEDQEIPGTAAKKSLAAVLRQDIPISITGVHNVWCCSASVGKKFALLNIIQTAD